MTFRIHYRGFVIELANSYDHYGAWASRHKWAYTYAEYDGAPDSPTRSWAGSAHTIQECLEMIDWHLDA